jgi:hypothetical protein
MKFRFSHPAMIEAVKTSVVLKRRISSLAFITSYYCGEETEEDQLGGTRSSHVYKILVGEPQGKRPL